MSVRRIRLVLGAVLVLAGGCAAAPPSTGHELELRCARDGGWWRPDDLMGGLCEFQSPGMI